MLEFLIYYISGCPSDFQPSELLSRAILFTALLPSLGALSGTFYAARDQIQETCGTDVTPLTTASKVAAEGLCRFSRAIQGVGDLMVGLDGLVLLISCMVSLTLLNNVLSFVSETLRNAPTGILFTQRQRTKPFVTMVLMDLHGLLRRNS